MHAHTQCIAIEYLNCYTYFTIEFYMCKENDKYFFYSINTLKKIIIRNSLITIVIRVLRGDCLEHFQNDLRMSTFWFYVYRGANKNWLWLLFSK